MTPTPLLLFGDQLGTHFHGGEHAARGVLLVESEQALRRHRWHRQKLHLVLSALRHAQDDLGERATRLRADDYRVALHEFGRPVLVFQPTSWAADRLVRRLRTEGLIEEILPTPGFALSREEFGEWAGARTKFRMEEFYRDQRLRFEVLMDGEQPVGGRWNLDQANREPPPRGRKTLGVPAPYRPREDEIDERVRRDLDALDLDTVGHDGPRRFAVTPQEARRALHRFVEHRLAAFGAHEDAIMAEDWAMAHSLLSVPLNLGVLHPLDAVHAAEDAHRDGSVPLAAAEGFIRQVLGWREYIWQLYWHLGPGYPRRNALGARAGLPDWWVELDADAITAACLSDALAGVRDRGWVHHIQRLMVLGNHALQRGFDPAELSDWFATAFVDGFAWVMPPNVIGMSQHADGGLLATKPYASGGAYLNRMSDHCSSCAFDPKVRVGDNACPFTAGYWTWVDRHARLLSTNQRTVRAVGSLRRLPDREAILHQESVRESF